MRCRAFSFLVSRPPAICLILAFPLLFSMSVVEAQDATTKENPAAEAAKLSLKEVADSKTKLQALLSHDAEQLISTYSSWKKNFAKFEQLTTAAVKAAAESSEVNYDNLKDQSWSLQTHSAVLAKIVLHLTKSAKSKKPTATNLPSVEQIQAQALLIAWIQRSIEQFQVHDKWAKNNLARPVKNADGEEVAAKPSYEAQADIEALNRAALEFLIPRAKAQRAAANKALAEATVLAEKSKTATDGEIEKLQSAVADKQVEIQNLLKDLGESISAIDKFVASIADEDEFDLAEYQVFLTKETGVISLDNVSTDMLLQLMQSWIELGKTWLKESVPGLAFKLLLFLAILFGFKMFSWFAAKMMKKAMNSPKVRASTLLKEFFISISRKTVMILGVMIAVSSIGINITPLLAGLGVFGFVIGFAMQETLSNFSAGVMILMYRPYDIGDVISAGGVTGKVNSMSLVSTNVLTPDNQLLVVPNNKIWGDVITNVTANNTRRVDLTIGIAYEDDIELAEKVLKEIVLAHDKILKDPEPAIKIGALGASSVDILVRPWCRTSDYWDVYWDLTRSIKQVFDERGLNFPYPQRTVHVVHSNSLDENQEGAA